MSRTSAQPGQALVELALVLPLLVLLGCGAVAIVQVARTQMALATAASATALVGARAPDATAACSDALQQLRTVVSDNSSLMGGPLSNRLGTGCTGPLPQPTSARRGLGFAIWLGYGEVSDTFCRRGGPPTDGITDGEVVVSLTYRPKLGWIPVVGNWLAPTLTSRSVQKVDPFRSRDPRQNPAGDNC